MRDRNTSSAAVTSNIAADAFFDTYEEAHEELMRRKAAGSNMITKMESSGYGGYRVWSLPVDLYLDLVMDSPGPGINVGIGSTKIPA